MKVFSGARREAGSRGGEDKVRLVMLGPPGSGKGTQGEKLSDRYKIPLLSSGDILRAAVRAGTEVGKKAEAYLSRGELVPDGVIVDVMTVRLKEADCKNGYILDGFPRTAGQANALGGFLKNNGLKLDAVVNLIVADSELVGRLSARRQCSKCSAVYHLQFRPSAKQGVCDKCGSALYQRDDDKEETIKNRLTLYKKETAPLIDYYKGMLINIEGKGNGSEIFERICSLIERK